MVTVALLVMASSHGLENLLAVIRLIGSSTTLVTIRTSPVPSLADMTGVFTAMMGVKELIRAPLVAPAT